jgi:transposase
MIFKKYNQNQGFLLPPNYSDFLGESHEAIILDEFINELDTTELEKSYNNQNGGRSAYHPVMLLKLLIYGYMSGVFSSRKIASKLKQDLAFMYLAGNNTPDFRTIARFRKEKGEYLEDIFIKVVNKANSLGFVSFGTCSLDGTKLYANASQENNYTVSRLEEKIREYIKQAEDVDEMEDKLYGDNEDDLDSDLKTKAGREKKKEELKEKQKRIKIKLDKISKTSLANKFTKTNTTDSDSKFMKMKHHDYANGYNVQAIVENGVILSSSVFNSSADQGTFIDTVKKLQNTQQTPEKILADKGYSSADNYSFCEENNIDAYIPIHLSRVDMSTYDYDKKTNIYKDKQGRKYHFKQFMRKIDKNTKLKKNDSFNVKQKYYKTALYEYVNEKTKQKKYLSASQNWQNHIKKQRKKFSTVKGKQIYRQRMHDVEGVFGNIKKNLKFTSFNLRGFKGVNTEWTLIALAHNIKKLACA